MRNIILKLDGEYVSTKESIIKLVTTISKQINHLRAIDIKSKPTIDLSKLKYIDSNISVILFAYLRLLGFLTPADIMIAMPQRESLNKLLSKNNFSSLWNEEAKKDLNGTVIKITESKSIVQSVSELQYAVRPILEKVFNAEYSNEIISALAEVCNNAFERGNAKFLYMCGQFYPNIHKLCLTLVNFGDTFQDNFIRYSKDNQIDINENKYISWAMQENNTTETDSLGLGLSRFMEVINHCNSELTIISGSEVYTFQNKEEYDEMRKLDFKGTIINISFNLNADNFIKI